MGQLSYPKLFLIFLVLAVGVYFSGCAASRGSGSSSTSSNGSGASSPSGSSSGSGSSSSSGSGSGGSGSSGGSGGSGTSNSFAAGVGGAGQVSAAKFLFGIQVPGGTPVPAKVDSDGTLTAAHVSQTTGINANNPPNAAIDPSGTFLYQAAQPGIWGYTINRTTGDIAQMPNTPFASSQNFETIAIDQTGRFLYAYGGGEVFAYAIQSGTGQLVAVPGSPFMAGPPTQTFGPTNRLAVDQTNKFLYVSTSTGIIGFTIDSNTGALTMISGSPFGSTVKGAYAIVVVPSDHLYESTYSTTGSNPGGGIYGYSIDPNTGALTAVAGSPFSPSCGNEINMTAPAQGNLMFAAGCGMFTVNTTTGALTLVANDPGNVGVADWPVFDPAGKLLWLITNDVNCWHCDTGVTAYDVNPTTGALTVVPNSFFVMQNSFSGGIVSVAITQ